MLIDLVNEVTSVNNIKPAVYAATTQGASVDLSNCEISTNMIVDVGAFGANTTTFNVQCEESADGSTNWAAISGMVVTNTTSNTHTVVRGLRTQKYVRANAVTVTGATPSVACSVELVSQNKYVGTGGGYTNAPSA